MSDRARRSTSAAVMLALAAWCWLSGCSRPVRGNRTNVLLVTLETTRADHLGVYGYSRETSPRLDAWAATGTVFDNDISVSPRTNPSLASLMTAAYPHEHGVRNLMLPLEPENRTLAETLRDAGYRTGAVQTHPRLVASSGFAQGFRDYDDDFRAHPLADASTEKAWRWIRDASSGSRPWFLWLHVMDPHWTYDPPAPWRTMFGPDDDRPAAVYRDLAARRRTIGPIIFQNAMPPDEIAAFVSLYDAEIRYTDQAVGRLLDRLREAGLDRSTLVVVTADHGESLGEHRYFFEHGDRGGEAEIRVPLIFARPGTVPSGRRVGATVRSIDVTPTIVDLVGLPPERHYRGVSLRSYFEGDGGGDRICLGETDKSMHEENALREIPGIAGKWRWAREGRFKLRYVPHADGRIETTLFDLVSDPTESIDASAAHPDVAARLTKALAAWMAEDPGTERDYHISDEAREQLRSLGYVN